jgi:hypothetical protein
MSGNIQNSVSVNGVGVVLDTLLNAFVQTDQTAAQLRGFVGITGMAVLLQGISAPGDGAGGMFYWNVGTAFVDDNNNTIVPYGAVGQGAWLRAGFGNVFNTINVKNYGATGNGVTDDSDAIQSALNAASNAGNAAVYFPAGTYVCSGLSVNRQLCYGDGKLNSILSNPTLSSDTMQIAGNGATIRDIGFTSTVIRTGGNFINILSTANYTDVQDFEMNNFFVGVSINGQTGQKLTNGRFLQSDASTVAVGVVVNGGIDLQLKDLWIVGTSPSEQLSAGVTINSVGDITLDHVSTVYAGDGISIQPGAGAICQAIFITNSFFDSGTGAGISVQAAGQVQLLKISDTWVATNSQHGIVLNTSGTGSILQVDMINSLSSNNTLNGLIVNTSSVSFVTVTGCGFGSNVQNGIYVSAASQFCKFIGNNLGAGGEFAGNGQYGLVVASASANYFQIVENTLINNGSGGILNSIPTTSMLYIAGNLTS